MMDVDARNITRMWVEDRANEGDCVGLIGWYMPTLGPSVRPVGLKASRAAVTASMPEWLMLNGRFATRYAYDRSPMGRELLAGLADGSLGYEEVFRYRAPVPAWAILQYDEQFRRPRESSWTNLDKINPGSVILSGVMMFEYLGWGEAATLIVRGLENAIKSRRVTYDLARQMPGSTEIATSAFGDQIIAGMRA